MQSKLAMYRMLNQWISNSDCSSFSIQTDSTNLISRNHCEIYVIVYEPSVNHVYVRDRKSVNGTLVNGVLIGIGPQISSGYLLQDGDVIEIRPHWKFHFHQPRKPPLRPLTVIQTEECQVSLPLSQAMLTI